MGTLLHDNNQKGVGSKLIKSLFNDNNQKRVGAGTGEICAQMKEKQNLTITSGKNEHARMHTHKRIHLTAPAFQIRVPLSSWDFLPKSVSLPVQRQ